MGAPSDRRDLARSPASTIHFIKEKVPDAVERSMRPGEGRLRFGSGPAGLSGGELSEKQIASGSQWPAGLPCGASGTVACGLPPGFSRRILRTKRAATAVYHRVGTVESHR